MGVVTTRQTGGSNDLNLYGYRQALPPRTMAAIAADPDVAEALRSGFAVDPSQKPEPPPARPVADADELAGAAAGRGRDALGGRESGGTGADGDEPRDEPHESSPEVEMVDLQQRSAEWVGPRARVPCRHPANRAHVVLMLIPPRPGPRFPASAPLALAPYCVIRPSTPCGGWRSG